MSLTTSDVPAARRVQRVRHELRRRDLTIVRRTPIGPQLVALTFGGEALADFVSAGFDDHVRLIFEGRDGSPQHRDYTPRHFDAQRRELTIEFVLHGHGEAADWAQRAAVGDRATIGGPRGSMIVPLDYDWHLLAGDATALPAVRRRLAEMPAGTPVQLLLQVADEADRPPLNTAAALDTTWVADDEAFVEALRRMPLPPGEGYVWCAGEAAVMARARGVLLGERQLPREAMRVAAYWKRGATGHHQDLTD